MLKYVLSKFAFMSKIVASFAQKAKCVLDLAKGWLFTLVTQDTDVIVDLKVMITVKT